MRLGLSEILKYTSEQPTVQQQGEYIRQNFNPTLGKLIQYAYDPMYQWDLPEGTPPYTPNQFLDQESNLYTETRRLYIFFKGTGDHVPLKIKEKNFIQLLENLSAADADLLISIKNHQLPYGITADFIRSQLPGLLSDPVPQRVSNSDKGAGEDTSATFQYKPKPTKSTKPSNNKSSAVGVTKKKATSRKSVANKTKPSDD